MIISATLLYIIILLPSVLSLSNISKSLKISKNCFGDSLSIISGITVRVIEAILDNASKEYLATNLLGSSFTPDMFELISSKSSNKHRYQDNRAYIIGRVKKILPQILSRKTFLSSIDSLFLDACRCLSQILPGRSFRRKKNKAKGRTHFRNLKVSF